jgi:hypothetical protein
MSNAFELVNVFGIRANGGLVAENEGTAHTVVRVEIAPQGAMPEGCRVVPIERKGELVWVIREGEMSEGLRVELNQMLAHIQTSGLWVQNWDNETPPHPH